MHCYCCCLLPSDNYAHYAQEHSDKKNYHVQYYPTECTDLCSLDQESVHHRSCSLVKSEDPCKNMASTALLQETGGNGGEIVIFIILYIKSGFIK